MKWDWSSVPRYFRMISSQEGGASYRPRLGRSTPETTRSAVDLPMPLGPIIPTTPFGRGIGRR